jgi:branched-chain amino acid transport system ATP-binding protein
VAHGDVPALMVRDLEVVYGGAVKSLRGVSIVVRPGSIVALLGANGAGKTTLLRAVSGLLPMSNGSVRNGTIDVFGVSAIGTPPAALVRAGLAQVMEGRRIFAEMTVDENLRAGAHTRRNRAEVQRNFERVMQLFPRLAERRRQTAGYLSGGEQQMLAIGRALMASPKLLLLDEPSLGLAPLIVEQIASIIRDINASGTSVLLVEQNTAMALDLATYAYVLEHGVVALHGPSDELRDSASVRALYLGGGSHDVADYRAMRDTARANALVPQGSAE